MRRVLRHPPGPRAGSSTKARETRPRPVDDERFGFGAADFLVRIDEEDGGDGRVEAEVPEAPQREHADGEPGLHVEHARAAQPAAIYDDGHPPQRADRPHGVHVTDEKLPAARPGRRTPGQQVPACAPARDALHIEANVAQRRRQERLDAALRIRLGGRRLLEHELLDEIEELGPQLAHSREDRPRGRGTFRGQSTVRASPAVQVGAAHEPPSPSSANVPSISVRCASYSDALGDAPGGRHHLPHPVPEPLGRSRVTREFRRPRGEEQPQQVGRVLGEDRLRPFPGRDRIGGDQAEESHMKAQVHVHIARRDGVRRPGAPCR